jgi:hypothetical protein
MKYVFKFSIAVPWEVMLLKWNDVGKVEVTLEIVSQRTAYVENCWVFGLYPSSLILETRKIHFGNWILFYSQVSGETRTLKTL